MVRRAAHPSVGLVLDSFHTLVRNTDLGATRAIPSDRIFLVQIADAPRLQKTRVQDVVDPCGVVQSQVVATADGSLRLVLNASQSQRTLASRFVSQVSGAGVQHIALAIDDIFSTVDRLRAAGVDLLRIPENYYDDLEARTDLSSVEVARLRESGILYDREGPAEYHQVFGFGAANAPIRLAAQTRLAPAKMPTI